MQIKPRFTHAFFILFLLSLSLLFIGSDGSALTKGLKEGDDCRDALKAQPERKKSRVNWERCVQKYKASSKTEKGRALYETARLYQELYLYSDSLDDIRTAARYYKQALQTPNRETFAQDAKKQLEKLEARLEPDQNNGTVISNIRHWTYPDYTRVVIDLNQTPSYQVERLASAQGLSVHISKAMVGEILQQRRGLAAAEGNLKKIEISEKEQNEVYILLTFKMLGAYKVIPISDPERLVIDVFVTETAFKKENDKKGIELEDQINSPAPKITPAPSPSFDIRTIVIDPGHGGKDPGAIGSRGLTEKEVVLDVSLRLRTLIQKILKKQVIMTRDRDIFIPLDERTLLANSKKADLFISVHANASQKRHTQGVEIYLLGRATDAGALATAARENGASQKEALDFQEIILNDLQRDFVLNESLELAHFTQTSFIENLLPKYPTADLGVKRAPFYVLAHTRMPAILAEISFISNPVEERRLQSGAYRQQVAETLLRGVEQYLQSLKANS